MPDTHTPRPLSTRLLWLVLLWAGGVAATGLVGLLIRLALKP